jgi:hypothetical protein
LNFLLDSESAILFFKTAGFNRPAVDLDTIGHQLEAGQWRYAFDN